MKKNKDIASILLIIFNFVFIISMIFAASLGVIHPYYKLNKIFIVGVTIIEIIVFGFLIWILRKSSEKSLKILSIINFFIFLVILIIFAFGLKVTPSWDFGTVFTNALNKANDKSRYLSAYYYDLYTNNIFITVVWAWIYKIFNIFSISYLYGSITINVILEFIAMVITYFLIKDLYGLRVSTIYSYLLLLMTPIYSYAPIFYTDTMSLMFLPLIYLLFSKYTKNEKWVYLILIGILSAIGIGIRDNTSIGIIALAVFILFKFKNIKKILKTYSGILIPFVILTIIISGICQANIPRKLDQSGFPFTHWIMMGLQGDGAYCQADVNASLKAGPNKENIEKFNEKIIKERLEAFGVEGYLKFLVRKNELTWGDGTDGGPFYLERKPLTDGWLYKHVVKGDNEAFLTLGQGTQLFTLILVIISSLTLFKDKKRNVAVLCNIAIFGTFLFLMIWETCPRYIFCMLPIILVSGSNTINRIYYVIEDKIGN